MADGVNGLIDSAMAGSSAEPAPSAVWSMGNKDASEERERKKFREQYTQVKAENIEEQHRGEALAPENLGATAVPARPALPLTNQPAREERRSPSAVFDEKGQPRPADGDEGPLDYAEHHAKQYEGHLRQELPGLGDEEIQKRRSAFKDQVFEGARMNQLQGRVNEILNSPDTQDRAMRYARETAKSVGFAHLGNTIGASIANKNALKAWGENRATTNDREALAQELADQARQNKKGWLGNTADVIRGLPALASEWAALPGAGIEEAVTSKLVGQGSNKILARIAGGIASAPVRTAANIPAIAGGILSKTTPTFSVDKGQVVQGAPKSLPRAALQTLSGNFIENAVFGASGALEAQAGQSFIKRFAMGGAKAIGSIEAMKELQYWGAGAPEGSTPHQLWNARHDPAEFAKVLTRFSSELVAMGGFEAAVNYLGHAREAQDKIHEMTGKPADKETVVDALKKTHAEEQDAISKQTPGPSASPGPAAPDGTTKIPAPESPGAAQGGTPDNSQGAGPLFQGPGQEQGGKAPEVGQEPGPQGAESPGAEGSVPGAEGGENRPAGPAAPGEANAPAGQPEHAGATPVPPAGPGLLEQIEARKKDPLYQADTEQGEKFRNRTQTMEEDLANPPAPKKSAGVKPKAPEPEPEPEERNISQAERYRRKWDEAKNAESQAKKDGIDPDNVHYYAGQIDEQDRQEVARKKEMLQEASDRSPALRTARMNAESIEEGGAISGLDVLAQELARRYPENFLPENGRNGHLDDQLLSMFHDYPKEMRETPEGREEIYRRASDIAKHFQEQEEGRGDEPGRLEEGAGDFDTRRMAAFRVANHKGQPKLPGFAEEQPKQKSRGTKQTATSDAEAMKNALPPVTGEQAGQIAATAGRKHLAEMARRNEIAAVALKEAHKHFDKTIVRAGSDKAREEKFLEFMDASQAGRHEDLPPEEQALSKLIRKLNDEQERRAKSRGIIRSTIENYIGQIWKKPGSKMTPEQIGQQMMAKRPLAGGESFGKQKKFPTYRDGIEAGYEPIDWNPATLVLMKAHEVNKSIMGHDWFDEMKTNGVNKFFRLGQDTPEGWASIGDKLSRVFAPPQVELTEYHDKQQYEGLQDFAKKMGFKVTTDMGGGEKAGSAKEGGDIMRKFGSPESVLIHEIGHQLDYRYGLAERMSGPELERLADLRTSEKAPEEYTDYIRQPSEQVANFLTAYLHAPELLKEHAPNAAKFFERFINDHPELKALRDIKPSLELSAEQKKMRLAGPMLTGNYYMPAEVAKIFNNYLEPGLRGNKLYDTLFAAGNALNQMQLGMSYFHAGETSINAAVSSVSLGLQQISRGDFMRGLKSIAIAPAKPFTSMIDTSPVLKEYYAPGSQGQEYARDIDMLINAGGRVGMESFGKIDKLNSALRDVAEGKASGLAGVALHAAPAITEFFSKPMMEHMVPRMKIQAFLDMARYEMEKMGPDAGMNERRAVLAKAWDSIDNRFGQLVYDNLFMNKVLKDVLQAGVRSVGWNLGTIRELGGGIKDIPQSIKDVGQGKGISPRLAYVFALPVVTGFLGAIYQYAATGKWPEELKDYFAPKTGHKREDGSDDRVMMPTYMKDAVAFGNRGDEGPLRLAQNAGNMAMNKANPIVGLLWEMLVKNEDFYGKAIRNPNDPAVKQSQDLATYLLKTIEPFSFRAFQQEKESGAKNKGNFAQSMVGISPAPATVTRSWQQQRDIENSRTSFKTPLEKKKEEEFKEDVKASKRGKELPPDRQAAVDKHLGSMVSQAYTPQPKQGKGETLSRWEDTREKWEASVTKAKKELEGVPVGRQRELLKAYIQQQREGTGKKVFSTGVKRKLQTIGQGGS